MDCACHRLGYATVKMTARTIPTKRTVPRKSELSILSNVMLILYTIACGSCFFPTKHGSIVLLKVSNIFPRNVVYISWHLFTRTRQVCYFFNKHGKAQYQPFPGSQVNIYDLYTSARVVFEKSRQFFSNKVFTSNSTILFIYRSHE